MLAELPFTGDQVVCLGHDQATSSGPVPVEARRPPEAHSWRASRLPFDFFRLAREAVLFAAAAAHAAGSSRSMATDSTGSDGGAAPSIGPALIGSRGCRIGSISQARIFTRAASASRRWRSLGGRWIGGLRWR